MSSDLPKRNAVRDVISRASHRIKARGLARNTVFAIAQGVFQIIAQFSVYRLLVSEVGMAQLGVWSLLFAFLSLLRSADSSGMGALARYAAMELGAERPVRLSQTIQTVFITGIALNTALAISLFACMPIILPYVLSGSDLTIARNLNGWLAVLFILASLATGVSSALDGVQRADMRALLSLAGTAIFAMIAFLAIPTMGLEGFALAFLAQNLLVFFVGWCLLRREVHGIGWLPSYWDRIIFRETFSYSIKLNVIGLTTILLEPLAKFAINYAGGTTAVATYELASRVVLQIRSLVVSAATPLIPAFAVTGDISSPRAMNLLDRSRLVVPILAVCIAVASLFLTPLMSLFVLGEVSQEITTMNALLVVGWSINILSLPLYLAGQSFGVLFWNFLSHFVIGICVIIGVLLTEVGFGENEICIAISFGLIIGTLITMLGNAIALRCLPVFIRAILPNVYAVLAVGLASALAIAWT